MDGRAERTQLPVTALVSTSMFFMGVTYASTLPYGGIVAIEGLRISNADYALILSGGALVGAVAAVALGWLSDKVGDRRRLVIACALLGALGYGLIYLLRSPLSYVLAYCIIMPFGGALFSQTFSFARSYYNVHEPARAEFLITVLRTGFVLAWVLIPPVAGWIAASTSVFDVYALASGAYLCCALIFTLLLADGRTRIGVHTVMPAADGPPARGIALPMLIGIGGVLLVNVALRLNATAAPLAIVNSLGGTVADVGLYAALAALLEVPCMLAWGLVAQRFPKWTIIVASSMLYALYLLLLSRAGSFAEVLWLQGLNAVATAALMAIPISYMQEAIRGRVGLSTSLLDVVGVASGLLAAGIFALATAGGGYQPALVAAALLAAAGATVVLVAHARPRRRLAAD